MHISLCFRRLADSKLCSHLTLRRRLSVRLRQVCPRSTEIRIKENERSVQINYSADQSA